MNKDPFGAMSLSYEMTNHPDTIFWMVFLYIKILVSEQ